MMLILALLVSSPALPAAPYDVPEDIPAASATSPTLYASNVVAVDWNYAAGTPKVVIPASVSPATDSFESEIAPLGTVDITGVWHFTLPANVHAPYSELALYPKERRVVAFMKATDKKPAMVVVLTPGSTEQPWHYYGYTIGE